MTCHQDLDAIRAGWAPHLVLEGAYAICGFNSPGASSYNLVSQI
jgi:hypothetical protein